LAIGKGRRKLGGVIRVGSGVSSGEEGASGAVVDFVGYTSMSTGGTTTSFRAGSVAAAGTEESKAGAARGSEECGDGGGRTNDVGRRDWDNGPGPIPPVVLALRTGKAGGSGITSVSNDGSSDRLDVRAFRFAPLEPALPTTTVGFPGDLRGDFPGDLRGDLGWDLRKTG